jgi:hypothetical protein
MENIKTAPKIVRHVRCPKIIKNKVRCQKIIRNKNKEEQNIIHTYESIVLLLTELIKDSKDNLITRKPVRDDGRIDIYFIDSMSFLLNKNGLLEYYLEFIQGIDVGSCLKELKKFSLTIYRDKVIPVKSKLKMSFVRYCNDQ